MFLFIGFSSLGKDVNTLGTYYLIRCYLVRNNSRNHRFPLKILVSLLIIAIIVPIIIYNTSLNSNDQVSFNKEKLKAIYELKIPLINYTLYISNEYVEKIQGYVVNNISYVQHLGHNDTMFKQYVKNAISYLEKAKKINDAWKKLKLLREAYFELEKAERNKKTYRDIIYLWWVYFG